MTAVYLLRNTHDPTDYDTEGDLRVWCPRIATYQFVNLDDVPHRGSKPLLLASLAEQGIDKLDLEHVFGAVYYCEVT